MITSYTYLPNNNVELTFTCQICHKTIKCEVNGDDLLKWASHEYHVQDCFPYLKPEIREMFLTSICDECFNKMFKEED